jgi:hypothetical protein
MIRIATQPTYSPDWHTGFLALLPAIHRQAWMAFRHLKPEAREDATHEVVANALVAYARLAAIGKANLAYATPLANYAIAQVRDGRKVGARHSVRDVLSQYAQRIKGFSVDRLDRYDDRAGEWRAAVVEDRHAGPAETAAARIDISDWFKLLRPRDQKIAGALAIGKTTAEVAREFGVSPMRISGLRKRYRTSWTRFQSEDEDGAVAGTATG